MQTAVNLMTTASLVQSLMNERKNMQLFQDLRFHWKYISLPSFTLFMMLLFPNVQIHAVPISSSLNDYLNDLTNKAKAESKDFQSFSVERGKIFYQQSHSHPEEPKTRACSTCHSENPQKAGKTQLGKGIDPLAPSVNAKRFVEVKEVEKWFGRNCKWVLQRECSAMEKGDFIAYLHSL